MTAFHWPSVLGPLAAGEDLGEAAAHAAMTEIMAGRAEPAQIAAFIVALRAKGETVDEMTALVRALYDVAITVDVDLPVVDTAGTGGDGSGSFNISTAAAFVAAGAGAKVAKHGNRAASSQAGSADVLEALGVPIELEPPDAVRMLHEIGFAFFFAPRYHPAMRFAAPVRSALGIPTVFNFVGPLANPARARRQSIGVADPGMAKTMVGVLQRLGREIAFVFHGADGLDELSTTGPSLIYRLQDGEVTHAEFTPEDFGVPRVGLDAVAGGDAAANAEIIRRVLAAEPGPHRDISLMNAAPAIVAAGLAAGFAEAMILAGDSVDSGAAAGVLDGAVGFDA